MAEWVGLGHDKGVGRGVARARSSTLPIWAGIIAGGLLEKPVYCIMILNKEAAKRPEGRGGCKGGLKN